MRNVKLYSIINLENTTATGKLLKMSRMETNYIYGYTLVYMLFVVALCYSFIMLHQQMIDGFYTKVGIYKIHYFNDF